MAGWEARPVSKRVFFGFHDMSDISDDSPKNVFLLFFTRFYFDNFDSDVGQLKILPKKNMVSGQLAQLQGLCRTSPMS